MSTLNSLRVSLFFIAQAVTLHSSSSSWYYWTLVFNLELSKFVGQSYDYQSALILQGLSWRKLFNCNCNFIYLNHVGVVCSGIFICKNIFHSKYQFTYYSFLKLRCSNKFIIKDNKIIKGDLLNTTYIHVVFLTRSWGKTQSDRAVVFLEQGSPPTFSLYYPIQYCI